eukprot:CAMPEP_0180527824 /NCGR_PEP_ID=MMETSP1036_2-20121128/60449_1 /TAXON_ID=632150 /ORGANISM="Azadinium spinosum, Strain 3D9" /LENGTH=44 /DNA_ID= /DNA_START= /DNA_END= /DNA_ORIENTATION=
MRATSSAGKFRRFEVVAFTGKAGCRGAEAKDRRPAVARRRRGPG